MDSKSESAIETVGRVESVTNEICIVKGLLDVALNNLVEFSSGGQGIVLGFTTDYAQVIILSDFNKLKKGDLVKVIDDSIKIPVTRRLLGRVINPLGRPMDGLGDVISDEKRVIESNAKPIYQRAIINKPLKTGYLLIDTQIPIGLGQRELLLGERKVGNDDVAVDIIINQAKNNTGVISVYVAIDAETAATKRRIERLQASGALANTVVVVGRTSESASLNYIAPMVGVTIAEWFAAQNRDVLIVFDNLTRHAKVYRQLSLLLGRPASREAYPGDIFYLHSRLLERCGAFNESAGGGSITALPVVETQSEEATDFITTNLMSITDGHLLFKLNLSNRGMQPPIDTGFSVSRIGGRAQEKVLRELSVQLKQIIIEYGELEHFLSFGNDLRADTREKIELGKRAQSMFNQTHDECLSPQQEILLAQFIVSRRALNWPETQMEDIRANMITFVSQPPYADLLQKAYLSPDLVTALPYLEEILGSYEKAPTTPKPIEKKEAMTAETETITGILRDNMGKMNG
jgi:F-type H+-transporting ATPase subunit alpha